MKKNAKLVKRSRAILLTERGSLLFIERRKRDREPYWVAIGGGLHKGENYEEALHRELLEEIGGKAKILQHAFALRHRKAKKELEEHFFICQLLQYDLNLRNGPEFRSPFQGSYNPCEVKLDAKRIDALPFKTVELRLWLLDNLPLLQSLSQQLNHT